MSSDPIDSGADTGRGILFIISAPSGTGKSTLTRELLSRCDGLEYSVSTTTREKRASETNGVEYHFSDDDDFRRMIDRNEFIEHARVHGHYYGTQKAAIESALVRGRDVLLDIDIQGAANIRRYYPACVSIFLMPPSLSILQERLRNRGTEDEPTIRARLTAAEAELECAKEYDYVIVNDNVETAAKRLCEIVGTERIRRGRI